MAAGNHFRGLGLSGPTTAQVLEATGASRSRSCELRTEILEYLPKFKRPVGRPQSAEPRESLLDRRHQEIKISVLEYRATHPGSWIAGRHTVYSEDLRRFILRLAKAHRVGDDLRQNEFARACGIPLPTLKDWSRNLPDITYEMSSESTAPGSNVSNDRRVAAHSAMKRAVIHHPDYQTVSEMKRTISIHFRERNDYFTENPRRAGKKYGRLISSATSRTSDPETIENGGHEPTFCNRHHLHP